MSGDFDPSVILYDKDGVAIFTLKQDEAGNLVHLGVHDALAFQQREKMISLLEQILSHVQCGSDEEITPEDAKQ